MLVVVGGQSRGVGKTAVASGIIGHLRHRNWAAIKISRHSHGSIEGVSMRPLPGGADPCILTEEFEPNRTDSGRFLAAGALRSFWLRVPRGDIRAARHQLAALIASECNVLIESTGALEVLQPDVCLMVLDLGCADWKTACLETLGRADAFVLVDNGVSGSLRMDNMRRVPVGTPRFLVKPPDYGTAAVAEFVNSRFSAHSA
jgi:hypothetical protein